MNGCRHCGGAIPAEIGGGFCCAGCAAAYDLVLGLGLDRYYARRQLDSGQRRLRPEAEPSVDYAAHVRRCPDGAQILHLMVEGLHCAACVWLIESVLARRPGVVAARVNMSTRRLTLAWHGTPADADGLVASVAALGYRLVPFDPAMLEAESRHRGRELLRAMAVTGFAAGNVMLLSISVWAGHAQGMGSATRSLLHWLSALIALPAVAYGGVPFFRAALAALKAGRVTMDVPISLAVVLASSVSLAETIAGGPHAYFDSAVMLLFFLLVGRYLDQRARARARAGAEQLLVLGARAVTVVDSGGVRRLMAPSRVRPGMVALAAVGERIAVDGRVRAGLSDVDTSLINGETAAAAVAPGDRVFAGTVNMTGPLTLEVTAAGEGTLLAEIVRLVEAAERGRGRYVALADRLARLYAPLVHTTALATFLGWTLLAEMPWPSALLIAVAVLIVTCPCALALAVPAVHVVATGRLMRRGVLIKSATALERLAEADWVVFDKTGTLTEGRPRLADGAGNDREALRLAASMAAASRHPLARALARAVPEAPPAAGVREVPGLGLAVDEPTGEIRLGSRAWCGIGDVEGRNGDAGGRDANGDAGRPELWLARPGSAPVRFAFADSLRPDAAQAVAALARRGYGVELLSGDRRPAVAAAARDTGIARFAAGLAPDDKCRRLAALAQAGRRVLMVGDGLNDAPSLAAASVSISPSTAVDVSQNAADVVFQGDRLAPVVEALAVARRARALVRQNLALALAYNLVAVPLAVAGWVTPLIAAVAMSASSLTVMANALRLAGPGRGEARS